MELFSLRGVTGLPDKFPILTISWVVFAKIKLKRLPSQKQPIFLSIGEDIWQASDSSLTIELHGQG